MAGDAHDTFQRLTLGQEDDREKSCKNCVHFCENLMEQPAKLTQV